MYGYWLVFKSSTVFGIAKLEIKELLEKTGFPEKLELGASSVDD